MQKVDDIKPCYPLFRQDEYKETLGNKKAKFEEGHADDKVQEIFNWTTTMEYRELNFKREALTVNPAKACQPLGAVLCALGFEKTLPYVHGSQGCVAYFRTYFNRHFREPVSCVSDSMTEDAAVFGGQKNMIDGLENAMTMYKPDMIAVSTTCMAEVIGDDLNAFITNTKKAGGVPMEYPTPCAHTPSFVGSHVTGWDNMFEGIIRYFTLNTMEGKEVGKNGKINLVPGFETYLGNYRVMERMMKEMGVDYTLLSNPTEVLDTPADGEFRMYAGGTTQDEVKDAPNAITTFLMQPMQLEKTKKYVEGTWKHEAPKLNIPMGLEWTDEWLMKVSEVTGKAIPASLLKERGRFVDMMTDSHTWLHGKKISLYGDPDFTLGMTKFLTELGIEPLHVLCNNGSKKWTKAMKAMLEETPYGKNTQLFAGADLWHFRSLVLTEKPDFMIGNSYAKAGQGDAYAGIPATGGDFAKAVAVCIGDKQCQRKPKGVMCPSFRATDDAAHSPGGRVKVLKAALNGELGDDAFADSRLAAAMELCVGCKGCKRECANQVDMAAIKIEYQAQRNARLGVSLRDRMVASLPHQLQHRHFVRNLIRWRNRAPWLAKLGETLFGIAANRRLPEPAAVQFIESPIVLVGRASARHVGIKPDLQSEDATLGTVSVGIESVTNDKDVILFVDTFALHFDPEIAHAAHQVLTAAGYNVSFLQALADDESERALCCGRTYLSLGQVEQARREAQRMQLALRPALEKGTPIVGLEPSCILSLRDDHLKLGLGEDAVALSKQVYLFEEFIAKEHDRKRFTLEFKPLPHGKTLVHGHCHQKAVGAMKSLRKVLRLIPEFEFEFIEASCCGMAGSFGIEAEHADISMQMAELNLLPALRAAPDASILANGFSCRHQIREGANRPSIHVALLLRDALKDTSPC